MPMTASARRSRACWSSRLNACSRACSHISVYAPICPPTIDLRPPRNPCAIVGARTMMPRTSPLYSRTRRPCTSNVVETSIAEPNTMCVSPCEVRDKNTLLYRLFQPVYHPCDFPLGSHQAMSRLGALTQSLIGKKIIMAVTGVVLVGFLVGHMYGNLKAFQGPEHFNAHAQGLRTRGAPLFGREHLLWAARAILLAALLLHLWSAYAVTRASWAARPQGYHDLKLIETTYAARTMRWGGVLIFLFVVYHLLDLTFGRLNPGFQPGNVYRNVIASFQVPIVAGFYMAAMLVLALHLYPALHRAAPWRGGCPDGDHCRRVPRRAGRRAGRGAALGHGAARPHPRRSDPGKVGQAPLRDEAGESRQQAPLRDHRRRVRARGRIGGRRAGGAGLSSLVLLLPGLAAPGAQYRRAGRYQRRQELSE